MKKKFLSSFPLIIMFILTLFIIDCNNPYYPEEPYYFISYRFNANENDALSSSVVGSIDTSEKTVSLTVPYGTDVTSLVASFSLNNMGLVHVDNTPQVSRVTPNDFTEPVKYTLPSVEESVEPNEWYIQVSYASPTHYYVSINGDDNNNGSEESPWRTIQHAIDSVIDECTVIVNPGNYNENLMFDGRNLTVRSTDPIDATIVANTVIDGGETDSVVIFSNEDTSILKGFSIRNGNRDEGGGGININSNSSPTISDNIIENNIATHSGGGIVIDSSTPVIENNIITDNLSSNFAGGGIFVYDSDCSINGNTITSNEANTYGGGIDVYKCSPNITDNTISNNSSKTGGGICLTESDSVIIGNIITENTANSDGGGIFIDKNEPAINVNSITENSAKWGGGIYIDNSEVSITGNSITSNDAYSDGGGIYVNTDYPNIIHNIISGNSIVENVANRGGGIYFLTTSPILNFYSISNNTFLENVADYGGGICVSHYSKPILTNNSFSYNVANEQGGGIYVSENADLLPDDIRLIGWASPGNAYYRQDIPKDNSIPAEPIYGPADNVFSGNRHGDPLAYTAGAHVYFK